MSNNALAHWDGQKFRQTRQKARFVNAKLRAGIRDADTLAAIGQRQGVYLSATNKPVSRVKLSFLDD